MTKDRSILREKPFHFHARAHRDNATQRDALEAVKAALPDLIFDNKVQARSPIDMASRGAPIHEVRNGHRAAKELQALFAEILHRLSN